MDKVTQPHKADDKKCVFTEGINYFGKGIESIWGKGDKETLKLLKEEDINGKWINLAAGDGRYNDILLDRADSVVAADIDKGALSKLWHNTREEYRRKLEIKAFNITGRFPFEDESFDGVFCAGTLHLFPRSVFKGIFKEINRILKPGGKIILDFATDIRREGKEGKLIFFGNEPQYNLNEAEKLLRNLFKDYSLRIHESEVHGESKKGNPSYLFSCKFIILIAEKN